MPGALRNSAPSAPMAGASVRPRGFTVDSICCGPVKPYFRCLVVVAFVAALSLAAELLFVVAMRAVGKPVLPTSFLSVTLFSVSLGFVPFRPSPSRLSEVPLPWSSRIVLLIETAAAVAAFVAFCSWYTHHRHIHLQLSATLPAGAYIFLLLFSFTLDFKQLNSEATEAMRRVRHAV